MIASISAQATPITGSVGRFIQRGDAKMSPLAARRSPPIDLRDFDRINRRAGADFDACGPRTALEEATDLSHTRVHQIAHGDATGAPQRMAQLVAQLLAHPDTTPFPLIRGLMDQAEEQRAKAMTLQMLGADLEAQTDGETTEEARENVSQTRLIMALAPLAAASWDLARLRAAQRMELVSACCQFLDASTCELDRQLALIADVRALLRRVKR